MGLSVFYGFDHLPRLRHPVVSVGTFDGVHRGHRELIRTLLERARARGGEAVVVTFESHPRAVDVPLTSLEEKLTLLGQTGVDAVVVLPFTEELRRLTAREFIGQYLVDKLGVEELVAGFDHRMGSDRSRDFDAIGREFGLAVTHAAECRGVSSTRIRQLLQQGHTREAERLLGR